MYCLDYAERRHYGNQLSFMLHELVLFGYQIIVRNTLIFISVKDMGLDVEKTIVS